MKIVPNDTPSGQVSRNRLHESSIPRAPVLKRSASQEPDIGQPVSEIRKQLLVVQRSLGRYQSILGGLEGFKILLQSDAGTADDYIGKVMYRGQAVLEPYSDRLERILQNKDSKSLQGMIENTRNEIHGLAVELSRLETAEQNSRSLISGSAAISEILGGIRSSGEALLRVEAKNVLDLLG